MDVFPPIYTAWLGAFLIVLQTLLAVSVGGYRGRNRTAIGHANDAELERRVRRHGNMTEYAPIFLTVLGLYELVAGQTLMILWLGILFGAGRVFHVIGFSSSAGSHLENPKGARLAFVFARMLGTALTLLLSLAVGGLLAWHLAAAG